MSVLDPLSHALATLVAGAHAGLATLGADPASGATWLLSIAVVVVIVRLALLPLVVRSVRQTHAAARARPHLRALGEKYRGRTDAESLRELMAARRVIAADHGLSRLGFLPMLLQVPVWLALYQLLASAAAGTPVGAMDAGLVSSLAGATVLGVSLAGHGYLGAGGPHLVVGGLAVATAVLSYLTQRLFVTPNLVTTDLPEALARAQHLMPTVSTVGILVIGGVVPVALLGYWLCNAGWTLGQSAVVWRWFPTPGSPAAARRG
jgi:YidC/Oxa1 family membrane protein insertase